MSALFKFFLYYKSPLQKVARDQRPFSFVVTKYRALMKGKYDFTENRVVTPGQLDDASPNYKYSILITINFHF